MLNFCPQHGNECYCGDSQNLPDVHHKVDEAECNMACAGDPQDTCGGPFRMRLYKEAHTDIVTQYLGCHVDSAERILHHQTQNSDAMTPDLCKLSCSDYAYLGTQVLLHHHHYHYHYYHNNSHYHHTHLDLLIYPTVIISSAEQAKRRWRVGSIVVGQCG